LLLAFVWQVFWRQRPRYGIPADSDDVDHDSEVMPISVSN
jgi:hypothetical protein